MGETPMTANEKRIALYRKIEVGRKAAAGNGQVAFRQLLQNEFGMESRKDMSIGQLSRLVQVLAELGAKFKALPRAATTALRQMRVLISLKLRIPCLSPPKKANIGNLAEAGLFDVQSGHQGQTRLLASIALSGSRMKNKS